MSNINMCFYYLKFFHIYCILWVTLYKKKHTTVFTVILFNSSELFINVYFIIVYKVCTFYRKLFTFYIKVIKYWTSLTQYSVEFVLFSKSICN